MLLYMIFLVIVYLLYVDIGTSVLHKILDNAIPILRITGSLQYSCLENSMNRGTWRTTVYGVAKSRIRLSD